jgi:hypothetical protein
MLRHRRLASVRIDVDHVVHRISLSVYSDVVLGRLNIPFLAIPF